jgi:hypothetical protein
VGRREIYSPTSSGPSIFGGLWGKIAENSLTSDGPGEKTTENELPFGGPRLTAENNSIFSAVQINRQKYLKPPKKHYVSCSAS